MHACIHTNIHAYTYIRGHDTHIHIHIHIYIHICIHTRMHTYILHTYSKVSVQTNINHIVHYHTHKQRSFPHLDTSLHNKQDEIFATTSAHEPINLEECRRTHVRRCISDYHSRLCRRLLVGSFCLRV